MNLDIRIEAAKYYDLNPSFPDDIPFYISSIPSSQSSVLELGCGTGRVTLPLSNHCQYFHGIDLSPAMIDNCSRKLLSANVPEDKAFVEIGDITHFDLGRKFDLVIAPFRVMQNLESDKQVEGLFACIHHHLAPGGSCILNVFKPFKERQELINEWVRERESLNWEVPVEGGLVRCFDRRPRLDADNLVLYPELVYRWYVGDEVIQETVLKIVMRCYFPDDFLKLITSQGFEILQCWGGYQDELYGEGPELVVQFSEPRK